MGKPVQGLIDGGQQFIMILRRQLDVV